MKDAATAWGSAIPVNEARPIWIKHSDRGGYLLKGGTSWLDQGGYGNPIGAFPDNAWLQISHIRLPEEHPYYAGALRAHAAIAGEG